MTMGFQPAPASFQPAPGPSYTPVSAPPPVSVQPSLHPSQQSSYHPQLPRRSANPAAIAAGVLGLVLVVGLVWWLATRTTGKVEPRIAQAPVEKSKVTLRSRRKIPLTKASRGIKRVTSRSSGCLGESQGTETQTA